MYIYIYVYNIQVYTIIHLRLNAFKWTFFIHDVNVESIHWCRIVTIKSQPHQDRPLTHQYLYTRRMGSPKDARLSWYSCTRVLRAMICYEGWILRMLAFGPCQTCASIKGVKRCVARWKMGHLASILVCRYIQKAAWILSTLGTFHLPVA